MKRARASAFVVRLAGRIGRNVQVSGVAFLEKKKGSIRPGRIIVQYRNGLKSQPLRDKSQSERELKGEQKKIPN